MEYQVETLPGGTQVYCNANHRIGTDSLLLSSFCQIKPNWRCCDLGSGNGFLLLSLVDKGLTGPAYGIEIQADGFALLELAAKHQNLRQVQPLCQDFRLYRSSHRFDLVVSNPPYFTQGQPSPNKARATARHQLGSTLPEVCQAAARLLKQGGRFYLCYPALQLSPLFAALCSSKLEPKRVQFVRKTPQHSPWLVLVEARQSGGQGLTLLPDILLPPGQPLQYSPV